jgi:membrane protein
MRTKVLGELFVTSGKQWVNHKDARLGAALAYYAIISMAPLLVLTVAAAGLFFGREAVQGELVEQLRDLVGEQGGEAIQAMVASAHEPTTGTLAAIGSLAMLIFGAAGLFVELQGALNTIWEVPTRTGGGIWGFIRARLLSFSMVAACAFMLLVSLVVSAGLAAMGSLLGNWTASIVGQVIGFVASFAVITTLFAMIYRYLPDLRIAWGDVWLGAAVTALLFTIGKTLIGLYLGHSSAASAYGASGSLAVLLIWLYYSSQIFLFGAEFTRAYACRLGSHCGGQQPGARQEERGRERAERVLEPATAVGEGL